MIALEDVQGLVLERCSPLQVVSLPIGRALGCVLAEDVVVPADVPPFANTAMDGYAVRAADTVGAGGGNSSSSPVEISLPSGDTISTGQPERPDGIELKVVGVLPAGVAPPATPLEPGESIQIMTGAPMPPGADAVVMVEHTEVGGSVPAGTVRVFEAVEPGTHVRVAGSDYAVGTTALVAGTVLGPAHLGVLATVGLDTVHVWRRPRVGVMSTGDELVGPGVELAPGQIRDSNRTMLLGLLERDGFEGVDLGVVRDTVADVERAVSDALGRCDAVLSSGGVSKGEFDYVKGVLDRFASAGGESFELAVRIRPAKPLALAWLPARAGTSADADADAATVGGGDGDRSQETERRVAFFGLPGNPVSSMVSYQVIALPGLRRMAGWADPLPERVPALTEEALAGDRSGRLSLVRAVAGFRDDGRLTVRSAGGQSSHQLSGTTSANALALVPGPEGAEAGAQVEVLLLAPPGRLPDAG